MDACVGPSKWEKPHGTYRDIARVVMDACMSMMLFVAIDPPLAGVPFFYMAYPARGIVAWHGSNNNWTESGRL